jgi:hypothetical protein
MPDFAVLAEFWMETGCDLCGGADLSTYNLKSLQIVPALTMRKVKKSENLFFSPCIIKYDQL